MSLLPLLDQLDAMEKSLPGIYARAVNDKCVQLVTEGDMPYEIYDATTGKIVISVKDAEAIISILRAYSTLSAELRKAEAMREAVTQIGMNLKLTNEAKTPVQLMLDQRDAVLALWPE